MTKAAASDLTNIIFKIFERVTHKRLVWYLEKENEMDDRQFCFRKQRSTIDIISKTTKISGLIQEEVENNSDLLRHQENL